MNKHQNGERIIKDELADFTDQILEKNAEQIKEPGTANAELHALEQTVLRLKNAFNEDGPSEAVIQRMRQNIVTQWRQQENKVSVPYWKKVLSALTLAGQKWQMLRMRQRWGVAVSLITIVALVVISIPILNKVSSNQPAASGQSLNASVFVAFGALALLAVWFFRRKP